MPADNDNDDDGEEIRWRIPFPTSEPEADDGDHSETERRPSTPKHPEHRSSRSLGTTARNRNAGSEGYFPRQTISGPRNLTGFRGGSSFSSYQHPYEIPAPEYSYHDQNQRVVNERHQHHHRDQVDEPVSPCTPSTPLERPSQAVGYDPETASPTGKDDRRGAPPDLGVVGDSGVLRPSNTRESETPQLPLRGATDVASDRAHKRRSLVSDIMNWYQGQPGVQQSSGGREHEGGSGYGGQSFSVNGMRNRLGAGGFAGIRPTPPTPPLSRHGRGGRGEAVVDEGHRGRGEDEQVKRTSAPLRPPYPLSLPTPNEKAHYGFTSALPTNMRRRDSDMSGVSSGFTTSNDGDEDGRMSLDPENSETEGKKRESVDDLERNALRNMDYKKRKKISQRARIEFNVTCMCLFHQFASHGLVRSI